MIPLPNRVETNLPAMRWRIQTYAETRVATHFKRPNGHKGSTSFLEKSWCLVREDSNSHKKKVECVPRVFEVSVAVG